MTTDLLTVTLPAAPCDATRDAVLLLIAGDPIHARDRQVVVAAIRASVRPDGTTTANDWRAALAGQVTPCVVGAVVCALSKAGVLVHTGEWEHNTDSAGRNAGKPLARWSWHEPTAVAA